MLPSRRSCRLAETGIIAQAVNEQTSSRRPQARAREQIAQLFCRDDGEQFRTGRSMKQSPEVFKQQHFVRGKIAFDCLTRYHEVLAQSRDPQAMLLAAEQSKTLRDYRSVLGLHEKRIPQAIKTLLSNLEAAGKDADRENEVEAARLCIESLAHLLPIEPEAARILAELGVQYERSDDLKGLVPTIVQLLGAIQNPAPKVENFLQLYQL
jgi:hypothetical protein